MISLRVWVEQNPVFSKLPTTLQEASRVFHVHAGPIVLTKDVCTEAFVEWLKHSELGLHKSVILPGRTVYVAQACAEDHGRLRAFLCSEYPSVRTTGLLRAGSGAREGMKPDVFWEKTTCSKQEYAISCL